jgi:menaquinol-cytochrome c reductase iron-sulfur subunit
MKEKRRLDRREFLSIATFGIGGLISAVLGIPAVAYVLGPVLRRTDTEDWIQLGSVSKVELGVPTLFKAKLEKQTGWIVTEKELSVYVLTDNGRDFVAMSNICTHLGCRVRWIGDQEEFFCPCHNARFNQAGEVLDGPPPAPLDRYEVKVEEDQIYIFGG